MVFLYMSVYITFSQRFIDVPAAIAPSDSEGWWLTTEILHAILHTFHGLESASEPEYGLPAAETQQINKGKCKQPESLERLFSRTRTHIPPK
jgi:hypothetical protein